MLNFMVVLFYCKIIHILQESQLSFITGYHQLKSKEIKQKNIVSEQTEQKTKKQKQKH